MNTHTITSGFAWSLSRARDFPYKYIDSNEADDLAVLVVQQFDRRTGLTWDVIASTVHGPSEWAGDVEELDAIREDCADGVFAAFSDRLENGSHRLVVASGLGWRRDEIGVDAHDWLRFPVQKILRADDVAGDDSTDLRSAIVRAFNCRTGLVWDAQAGTVTAPNVDVNNYWAMRWDTLDTVRRDVTKEEILIDVARAAQSVAT